MARRRRHNPIDTNQVLLVLGGAVGGVVLYQWYQNQQAAAQNYSTAPQYGASTASTSLPAGSTSGSTTPITTGSQTG